MAKSSLCRLENKMQSEAVDFAPMPPPGDLDQTTLLIMLLLIFQPAESS